MPLFMLLFIIAIFYGLSESAGLFFIVCVYISVIPLEVFIYISEGDDL
jgi:hypothetical protein